jgi:hypothetical protein
MKEQIIKKPTINDYPSTDERTFVELDGKVNWEKYAMALDEFIVKLIQCKNIISKVKEANTFDKRSFEEAEADKAGINELIPDTSENANQYNGRPNPQDVNPYDGRAILRKRNK